MEEWRTIKPSISLPTKSAFLGGDTLGETLDQLAFQDIYKMIQEDGIRYFPRLTSEGDVEVCIIYEDIDSFGEQADAEVYLDFSRHKDNWIAVLWVVTDPEDPLGYPLSFHITKETDRYLAVRFLEQERIWIHYLADVEAGVMHLYSEAISFSGHETERAGELMLAAYRYDPEKEEAEEMTERTISGEELELSRLREHGFSFYFDYRLMENRFGEEGARELVMGTIFRALWMMRRHPNPQAREAELLLWIGEKVGKNRADEETRLLVVTMTPQLLDVYQVVNLSELEANPLATTLMALTEYQFLEEEAPLENGYIPIAGYEDGTLVHIEWEEAPLLRLERAFAGEYPHRSNPYRV
ncbi:hypothetical protein [Aneurinibacillus migulanus]|uniref:Uncharacterized protein n=1 Tax=Aneurinibacillus migulanus TaxID=47500 RepID=A0A0D1XY83_ANEMI|nr:hypothetical protein [Aneurinibacillus migulanus]KIV52012.1 hypothetical protein TS65_26100 [Aneurinibacillus migulanus]KON98142.1 hypothetical protein AF333_24580 [Aneurinibacillus migulanus]MED0891424.1 hypothetical protein [Aneurinibacillus migulanus]MED1613887.1 hypothetical protein [Aneurinibacillus migulanus]MED4728833.1 hypothetical protein [Aneurinibacillus migulanus]